MQKYPINLKPSGYNTHFEGEKLSFDEYIVLMQHIIRKSRPDITKENCKEIVEANSPFSLQPKSSSSKLKKGVLLIHGLFDSPFYVRDLGDYFLNRGFFVKAPLLPGHGTSPGDLLNISYNEWVKAVEFGLKSLANDVDEIYLAGYSLGGVLALHQYLFSNTSTPIKGLILFAPALETRSLAKKLIARYHFIYSWLHSRTKWFQVRPFNNYAKYTCYALNAGRQACLLIDLVESKLATKPINIPLFITISTDDETVSDKAIISFFLQQPHPKNKLIIYTNKELKNRDQRIIQRPSIYPQDKILNFSHSCLTISPQNSYLGKSSQFIDLDHYPRRCKIQTKALHHGAATRANMKNHQVSRLSYNPDFYYLTGMLDNFFESIDVP